MKPYNFVLAYIDDPPFDAPEWMPKLGALDTIDFPRMFAQHPLCAPSRATLFTGRTVAHHGVVRNLTNEVLVPSQLLAPALARRGYRCGHFGKYINKWPFLNPDTTVPTGWHDFRAFLESGGNDPDYYDYTLNQNGVVVSHGSAPEDYATDVLGAAAVNFVTTAPEPFFCYVPHWASHTPGVPADRHADLFPEPFVRPGNYDEPDIGDKPAWFQQSAPAHVAINVDDRLRDRYRCLQAVDDNLDALVAALASRGVLGRTIVMLCGDNSNLHGHHRVDGKPWFFEECIRVPFRVLVPGVAGRVENAMVSNIDLAPTICDYAGARMPIAMDGMTMRPLFEDTDAAWRDDVFIHVADNELSDCPPGCAVRTDDTIYVEYDNGEREFYDLAVDPDQLENRPSDPRVPALAVRLARLRSELA